MTHKCAKGAEDRTERCLVRRNLPFFDGMISRGSIKPVRQYQSLFRQSTFVDGRWFEDDNNKNKNQVVRSLLCVVRLPPVADHHSQDSRGMAFERNNRCDWIRRLRHSMGFCGTCTKEREEIEG